MQTFVGDILRLTFRAGIDLSGYDLYIKFRKPDGYVGFWDATIDTDVTQCYYETAEADLDVEGNWKLQVFAESGGTVRGHGRICELLVKMPLAPVPPATTIAPTT